MKNFISALVITVFSIGPAIGQIGVSGAYKTFAAGGWEDFFRSEFAERTGAADGYAFGVNYWFRLKKKRVEFLPEISYERYEYTATDAAFDHRILGFYFNTNIYPFDFENDCDCPTWSKTGNFFTKGFFVQISPGIWHLRNRYETDLRYEDSYLAWMIGGGAGIDFGISDFLTLTPMVKMYYSPGNTWSDLPDINNGTTSVDASIRQFYAGLKVGLRLKPDKRVRRR